MSRVGSLNARAARRRALGVRAMFAAGTVAFVASCSQVSTMRGEIEGLDKIASQAERNGAIRCAPRELAMAKSHLQFATIELDSGDWVKAKKHLEIATPNAHAAYDLSPPAKCAERGFEEPPTPTDPDTDGDGILDSKDQCVLQPEDKDGYEDADGCPEPDNDLDGIPDAQDKCPNEPEDADGFEDADGCPDPDNDKDGVLDVDDWCPNEPGPADNHGCPKKPSLVIVTDKEIKITQQIHFEFDKDKIRSESFPILDAIVDVLNANPKIRIEIQGHTDNKGSAAYNKALSDRRAASVKKYLIQHGIDSGRLVSHGYGMERPLVPNDTDQNRALNRRVQFIRTEGGTPP